MQPHFRLSICSVNLSLTVYCELTSLKSASVTGTRLNLGDRFGWSREEQLGCFAWQRAQRASAPKAVCPWGGARTQPQGCTGAWLHPFPSWVSSCSICPLELREGRGCWTKPISYKQEAGYTERICTAESCSVLTQGTGQLWLWQLPVKMGA